MVERGRTRTTETAVAAVVALALIACSCQDEAAPPTVVVTQTVLFVPGASPATPSPTPTGLSGVIVAVRTGFFGGHCPDGSEVRNGQPLLVGCTGFATATPVGQGDIKLPLEVHGPDCSWSTTRTDVVRLQQPGDNPFNIDVVALRPGLARISANVKGVVGFFDVEVR